MWTICRIQSSWPSSAKTDELCPPVALGTQIASGHVYLVVYNFSYFHHYMNRKWVEASRKPLLRAAGASAAWDSLFRDVLQRFLAP